MKQKLYALDAFFIEKIKLSEKDPYTRQVSWRLYDKMFSRVGVLYNLKQLI